MSPKYFTGIEPYDIEFEPYDLMDNLLCEMDDKELRTVEFTLHHERGNFRVTIDRTGVDVEVKD